MTQTDSVVAEEVIIVKQYGAIMGLVFVLTKGLSRHVGRTRLGAWSRVNSIRRVIRGRKSTGVLIREPRLIEGSTDGVGPESALERRCRFP